MQIVKLSLATLISLIVVVNGPFGFDTQHESVQTAQVKSADIWAQENYATALSMILPSGEIEPTQFPKNVKWTVTVRILPPFEKPEYRFSMQRFYDGRVEVSVIKVKGSSILSQLQTLRTKYPDDSLQKISGFVSLDQLKSTQSEKPQLSRLANEFEVINISPVLPDELRVDDTGYEFWSQSLWGNRMTLNLGGPGPGTRRQPHPLLEWAEAVRSTIEGPARAGN
ncbi:MAG TPA: hypothetical protein VK208_09830 [Pyrinomonadaceae bacterium]|jgi:hypothetical protein|nr:hypothetical protein [Pyrinomonadaceae bacterium]